MSEGNENTNGNILSEIYEYNARFPFLGGLLVERALMRRGVCGGHSCNNEAPFSPK
jgi:hypothetical protein